MIRTILFDLDGTLLDTAPDLAYALNQLLIEQSHDPLPYEKIRPVVSHGGRALIKLGFDITEADEQYASLRQRLLDIYRENIARHTTLFPGMQHVLEHIESHGMLWGVVTNKPAWLTEPLLKALNLMDRSACVVSGDTTNNSKPHPEPMLHACQLSNSTVAECLYVGDAQRDIEAGKEAGMQTLAALYGYIEADDDINRWGADAIIDKPEDIISWLHKQQ
jgi:phosphoglycolate phosphatase